MHVLEVRNAELMESITRQAAERSISEIVAELVQGTWVVKPLTPSRPGCSAATRATRSAVESSSCRVTTLRPAWK
jgi:hypothetical protein